METNNEILEKMWADLKTQELRKKNNEKRDFDKIGNLFYYTIGLITQFLCYEKTSKTSVLKISNNELQFSAKFLEIIQNIDNISVSNNEELKVFSAVAYVFAGFYGAANVVLKNITGDELTKNEKILVEIILNDNELCERNGWRLDEISISLEKVLCGEIDKINLENEVSRLCSSAYDSKINEDIIAAECIKKIINIYYENSTLNLMPSYSNTSIQDWSYLIKSKKVPSILWKSQRLLGDAKIFAGKSAVIELPTGSGKTASFSLVLRSALLLQKLSLGVIVVPFKAIQDEIFENLEKNFSSERIYVSEFSDEFIDDFEENRKFNFPRIVVVTPEKLFFLLHQNQDFVSKIDLFIFDESHQLDNGERGITYELLLNTINMFANQDAQKLFVSAVIGNIDKVSDWFNLGNNKKITKNKIITQNYTKSIGYIGWNSIKKSGELLLTIDVPDFLETSNNFVKWKVRVPNFLSQIKVSKKKFQPNLDKAQGKHWLTVLSSYQFLSSQGLVAIFVPQSNSTKLLAETFIKMLKLKEKDPNIQKVFQLNRSLRSIVNLMIHNFGENSVLAQAYTHGIFINDGTVPDGIRSALESEAQNNNIHLLICTSTLAQGVNLPIKTLVITDRGNGPIKINNRDLNNLMGRVGRSGIMNEGNIIFIDRNSTNSSVKDKKIENSIAIKEIGSSILKLFSPTLWNPYDPHSKSVDLKVWCTKSFLDNPKEWMDAFLVKYKDNEEKIWELFLRKKVDGISKIENFLMSNWDYLITDDLSSTISNIVNNTFASKVANEDEEKTISKVFTYLVKKIKNNISDESKIIKYGKTMVGMNEAISLQSFVESNCNEILNNDSLNECCKQIWSILQTCLTKAELKYEDFYEELLLGWINGKSYKELELIWEKYGIKIGGKDPKDRNIEVIYKICNTKFSYNMILKVASLSKLIDDEIKQSRLDRLQLAIKFGLPTKTMQSFYQLGIKDRYLSTQFAKEIGKDNFDLVEIKKWIIDNKKSLLNKFKDCLPDKFKEIIESVNLY